MRKLLLSALCGLAAGLWLLTAAACKSKTADDIRALAHKELQQCLLCRIAYIVHRCGV